MSALAGCHAVYHERPWLGVLPRVHYDVDLFPIVSVRKPLDAEQQNFNKLVARSSRFPTKAHLIRRPSFWV